MTTDELVDEIFGRCRERFERGEVVDVEEVLRVHPELADALRERFAAARLIDRAGALGRRRGADAAALTRVGTALGPYRIESVLGAGGMGTVFLACAEGATDAAAPGARVAVKVFHPHLVTRERFTARFLREAELGRRVSHPNVVRTLDADEAREADQSVRFLVMEHVQGRTLRTLLAESGRLPEELCRHIGREVARGLAAIHEAGAVHRDLKPENVIVTDDHVVKVMDLGVARVEDAATLSETGLFVGSLRYGAPEQFGLPGAAGAGEAAPRSPARAKGGHIDHRVDLHALGLLLYELATGQHPFKGEEFHEVVRQVLEHRPRRCGELVPQISPFLEELVSQLLEKDREKRPASAAVVASILADGEASAWWKERALAIRRETRRPLRRIRIQRETALYGRDSEIARLRGLYEKAKAGDGQVVLVEGEAGIGKSRLVDEFVLSLWAAGEDIDFLAGSYPPGGAATASGAFTTAYREHLGDDEAAVREALPQTPLLVPAFAALLRGDAPPEGAEKLTRDSIQTLFVHATRSFATRRTTIVLIDDLHFAPEEGRALFASLALATPGHRILLVGGARRSLDEKWAAGVARLPNLSRLPLDRLGPKDLVDLLDDALRSRHLAEDLAGRIAAKSDGNPFFVFEILRGLREGRFLTRKPDGTWVTTRSIREIDVPPSVVEVIQARVSDLGEDERNVLEVAACVGFEFDAALVGAVLRVEPIPLLQRLGRIEKTHRLVRSVGRRFAFDHHQVQEVLYAGLSAPLREAYHASIAEAIEARSGAASREPKDLDGALCVDLAEHFLRGANGERALRYLDRALTHLESRWLNDAAVRLCHRALSASALLTGRARCEISIRKAARLEILGQRDAERVALDEALALADDLHDPALMAQARMALGVHFHLIARYEDAQRSLAESIELSRAIGDRLAEAAALGPLCRVFMYLSRYDEARVRIERRLGLVRELGDRAGEANATSDLAAVLHAMGRFDEARTQAERSLELARESGDRRAEAVATWHLGGVVATVGLTDEGRAHFERCLAVFREIGDRRGEAIATGNLGLALENLGQYDDALARQERHFVLAREIGDRLLEAQATGCLSSAFDALGRIAEAREYAERHLALSRETGNRKSETRALSHLGSYARGLGMFAVARQRFGESLSLAREIGAKPEEIQALRDLAAVDADEGDIAGALRGCTEVLEMRRAAGIRHHQASVLVERGSLLAQQGRLAEARSDLEEGVALAREMRDSWDELRGSAWLAVLPGSAADDALAALAAHEARVPLGIMTEIRFLLWRATRDRAHLVEAKRVLDYVVEHAPPECRESMLTNIGEYREILAACREQGI